MRFAMARERFELHRFRDAEDLGEQAQVSLEAAQILSRNGNSGEARRMLRSVLEGDPDNTQAWLWLAQLSQDRREREASLRRVLTLEPEHPQARAELARLQGAPDQPAKARPQRMWLWRWVLGLMILAVTLFVALLVWGSVDRSLAGLLPTPTPLVTPTPTLALDEIAIQFVSQLQNALSEDDWERALDVVAILNGLLPADRAVREWTRVTHVQAGQALVEGGQVDRALAQFDQAVAVAPEDAEAQLWQRISQLYLAGRDARKTAEWDRAIESFSRAYEQMPEFGDLDAQLVGAYRDKGRAAIGVEDWPVAIEALVQARELAPDDEEVAGLLSVAYRRQGQAAIDGQKWEAAIETLTRAHEHLPDDSEVVDLLAAAHRQRGIVREEQGKLKAARADLEAALALRPDDAKAQAHLDEVMSRLFPPKRIEVDISRQRLYAWEGDTLLHNFPTSTGLPGQDTATGHYKVLSKIPMAYSSIWRLKMPYWLGIYYVGNIENGIHALPIRPDGSVMWGGLLGQRASYGCIILNTKAARLIYDWADIGTVVDVHY
jgi:tetratricopeptide (TPR) repeat protein